MGGFQTNMQPPGFQNSFGTYTGQPMGQPGSFNQPGMGQGGNMIDPNLFFSQMPQDLNRNRVPVKNDGNLPSFMREKQANSESNVAEVFDPNRMLDHKQFKISSTHQTHVPFN
jgi:hypothetical protein